MVHPNVDVYIQFMYRFSITCQMQTTFAAVAVSLISLGSLVSRFNTDVVWNPVPSSAMPGRQEVGSDIVFISLAPCDDTTYNR